MASRDRARLLLIRGDRRSSVGRFRREILDSPVFAPLREHLGDKFDRYIEEKIVVVPGDITNHGLSAKKRSRSSRAASTRSCIARGW